MSDAQITLNILNEHEDFQKLTIVEKIVEAIVFDILDRRGLKQEFSQIDKDIQEEIKNTWKEIITQIAVGNQGETQIIKSELKKDSANVKVADIDILKEALSKCKEINQKEIQLIFSSSFPSDFFDAFMLTIEEKIKKLDT